MKKAMPIFTKKTTWAILIAIPAAMLGIKAETANTLTDLLSLASSVVNTAL
ncbi:hypothetical protein [Sphingobium yanoikuyae]|uniref:hypothetical protein n=1 Tax=Sphingobium yanoikuyae TaxID=13690 RepID=UPI0031CF4839